MFHAKAYEFYVVYNFEIFLVNWQSCVAITEIQFCNISIPLNILSAYSQSLLSPADLLPWTGVLWKFPVNEIIQYALLHLASFF